MLHVGLDLKKTLITILDTAQDVREWEGIIKAIGILIPLVDRLDDEQLKKCKPENGDGEKTIHV